MSLFLTLVRAPHPQSVRKMRLDEGELVIGRSPEADWCIDDPDMFVSRAHCTVSGREGSFTVTDTSRGGLFLDEAGLRCLGAGNSTPLRHGMQLRLGDYVMSVELQTDEALRPPAQPPSGEKVAFDADDFFATPPAEEPMPARPPDLPPPFERPRAGAADAEATMRCAAPVFGDAFTLDPPPGDRGDRPAAGGFDAPEPSARPAAPPEPSPEPPRAEARRTCPIFATDEGAALADFFRGLGLEPADNVAARMEAFGREYRLMIEGLMYLLRKRTEEKSGARITRTVVGSSDVNPLKFMPTVEAALAVMIAERSVGFVDAETAISGAVRDLADHHVRTWRGIQAALRRMVDRFDPAMLEKECEALGLLETLLAGGRRAKLWELYENRYREIATSAETRFLGEVGEHFREAYEAEEK